MPVLKLSTVQLNLSAVLLNGQSFRWILHENSYYGTARDRFWKIRRKNENEIEFNVLASLSNCKENHDAVLREYLQADVDLEKLYTQWSAADDHIKSLLEDQKQLKGIRILDQDPLETLFAFICSANNNIKRISKMVNRLCTLYGKPLTVDSKVSPADKSIIVEHPQLLHSFPTVSQLAVGVSTMESQLRQDGFGYRAAYIANTVKALSLVDEDHFVKLRDLDLKEVKEKLRQLSGIGPKVADCICLMGLRRHEVVPIDTHVFKTTVRDYRKDLAGKSLTPAMHVDIGSFYIEKFGDYAGWAQAVLFNAQLAQKRVSEKKEGGAKKKKARK